MAADKGRVEVPVRSDLGNVESEIRATYAKAARQAQRAWNKSFDVQKVFRAQAAAASRDARNSAALAAKKSGRSWKDSYKDIERAGKLASDRVAKEFKADAAWAAHQKEFYNSAALKRIQRAEEVALNKARASEKRRFRELEYNSRRTGNSIAASLSGGFARAGLRAGRRFASGFSRTAKRALRGGAIALAGGAVVGGAGAKNALDEASQLQEAVNRLNWIMGEESAKSFNAWTRGSARSIGQSRKEVVKAAGDIGVFGKAAGLQGKQIEEFTKKVIKTYTDLGSFHDTTNPEALRAMISAFRNENEPIRRYGILIDDAALKAEALRKGLVKPKKDMGKILSAQNRVEDLQARLNKISRSGPGAAEAKKVEIAERKVAMAKTKQIEALKKYPKNSLKAVQATTALEQAELSLQKTKDDYNKKLLSSGPESDAAKKLARDLKVAQVKLKEAVAGGAPGVLSQQNRILASASLIDRQFKKQGAQGDFARTKELYAGQIKQLGAQWADLRQEMGKALLPTGTKSLDYLNDKILPALSKFGSSGAKQIAVGFKEIWMSLTGTTDGQLSQMRDMLGDFFKFLFTADKNGDTPISLALKKIADFVKPLGSVFTFLRQKVLNFFKKDNLGESGFTKTIDLIVKAWKGLLDFLTPFYPKVKEIFSGLKGLFADVIEFSKAFAVTFQAGWAILDGPIIWLLKATINTALDLIKNVIGVVRGIFRFFTALFKGDFKGMGKALWDITKDLVKGIFNAFMLIIPIGRVAKIATKFLKLFKGFGSKLKSGFINTLKTLATGSFKMIWAMFKGWATMWTSALKFMYITVPKKLFSMIIGLPRKFYDVGKSLIEGLNSGIRRKASTVVTTLKKWVTDKIPAAVKHALKINSPSKVMIPLGAAVPEGQALGIKRGSPQVISAAKQMARDVGAAVASVSVDTSSENIIDAAMRGLSAPVSSVSGGATSVHNEYNLTVVEASKSPIEAFKALFDEIELASSFS